MRQDTEILRVLDFTRLHALADETGLGVRGIAELFLDQMAEQLSDLRAAILAQSVHAVAQIAHRCAGSSMMAGMERLSRLLYELEHSPGDRLVDANDCAASVEREFAAVTTELEALVVAAKESGAAAES
jgi:HPt (histidine-containing phosphotransfer) domain-containing protein